MRKSETVFVACLAVGFGACSSKYQANGSDGYGASSSTDVGGYRTNGTGGSAASGNQQGGTDQGGSTQTNGGAGSNVGGGISGNGGAFSGTGGSTVCGPAACSPGSCGTVVDYCGNAQDCGTCSQGICGLNAPNVCASCAPLTCAQKHANCGLMSDGCGGPALDCGTCSAGQQCGIDGPNICGSPTQGGGAGACSDPTSGLCPQLADCSGTTPTTLTGTVLAPNGTLPLPNALVYIPNGSTTSPFGVQPFVDGVAAGACTCDVTGDPLVTATSDVDGTFTLTGVPAGANIPLVVQLGHWRRLVTIPNVAQCTATAVDHSLTSLPTRQGMGSTVDSIPLMALSTGGVDAMECVLRKMGVEDSQFSNAGGTGRVRFYHDNGATCTNGGGSCTGVTPAITQLTATQAEVEQYDALIFPCNGNVHDVAQADKTRVLDAATNTQAYVNKGGRAFFTHYSYGWLYNQQPSINLPWISTTTAKANDGTHHDPTQQVQIDTTFPRGAIFAKWLGLTPAVNALSGTNPPTIAVDESREVVTNPATWNNTLTPIPALRWAFYQNNNPNADMLHVTFDTPWGLKPEQQCGRVLYSGFHVTTAAIAGSTCAQATGGGSANTSKCAFPAECSATFTAQEKVLAYFLFDMTACVQPPDKTCFPLTCADQNIPCGPAGDTCGKPLDCGPCCQPQTCEAACPNGTCRTEQGTVDDGWTYSCPQSSGCMDPPTIPCWCQIG